MVALKTYSHVFSGFSFRNQLKDNGFREFRVLTAKDVNADNGVINYSGLNISPEFAGPDKYFLKDKDIVLNARGGNPRAFIFQKDQCDALVIASGAFIIIRVMEEYLDAGYLTWYLNLPESQAGLRRLHAGTTVQNLPITGLHDFMVPMPAKTVQKGIGKLYLQNVVRIQLTKERDEMYTQILNEELKTLLR